MIFRKKSSYPKRTETYDCTQEAIERYNEYSQPIGEYERQIEETNRVINDPNSSLTTVTSTKKELKKLNETLDAIVIERDALDFDVTAFKKYFSELKDIPNQQANSELKLMLETLESFLDHQKNMWRFLKRLMKILVPHCLAELYLTFHRWQTLI